MRHRVAGRRLSRTSEHRLAMRRNLAASLFEHETISTTMQKAKEISGFAEKLITLAKKGTLSARRRAIAMLGNRDIVTEQDGRLTKNGTIIGKLFSELGPRYLDRPGGYTRIIRLPLRRLGDNGQLVLLQLVGQSKGLQEVSEKSRKKSSRKSKKTTLDEQKIQESIETEQAEAEEMAEDQEQVDSQPENGEDKPHQQQE